MIKRLLIANRGEIACRIIRTAQRMGIETVAVFSDDDRGLPHTRQANRAVHIGGSPAVESYLVVEKIIAAAQQTGADAIHPGYGFLSESSALAKSCQQNGITFVGPGVDAIEAMGSKSVAKKVMHDAGVALLPGYHGENQDVDFLKNAADECGYPVLIKASAGGGGKGMRIVENAELFDAQLESAKREALAAFSDQRVIIEKYLRHSRHLEVQIFADNHGNTVHLYERECSIQRRFQKVIEEAPATRLTDDQRRELHATAVRAAQAIDYVGAGTVEFICDAEGHSYFMEMNTRLQVEHPVTEMICGIDLVEWQLRVAANERLPLKQSAIQILGHAIEARIYAEDAEGGFLPASGTLRHFDLPKTGPDLRIDTGFETGDKIGIHYDPMIAKLIVHASDRRTAARKMGDAILQIHIAGPKTNVNFLARIVGHADFLSGNYDTGFIDLNADTLLVEADETRRRLLAIAAAYLHSGRGHFNCYDPYSPWDIRDNWRMNNTAVSSHTLRFGGREYVAKVSRESCNYAVELNGKSIGLEYSARENEVDAVFDGQKIRAQILLYPGGLAVFSSAGHAEIHIVDPSVISHTASQHEAVMRSPMPGKIVAVLAAVESRVEKGDTLVVIEAMKMEHALLAPANGVVTDIHFKQGDTVNEESILIEMSLD